MCFAISRNEKPCLTQVFFDLRAPIVRICNVYARHGERIASNNPIFPVTPKYCFPGGGGKILAIAIHLRYFAVSNQWIQNTQK